MTRYLQGDKVEVLNMQGTLEDSWHPALIVDGDEDVYIVLYDAYANGVLEEWVLAKYIRPRPPVVEFSNWGRGDLVHVFDNFAWKLATVLHVSVKKQFLVRVVGSLQDLNVGAGWIRVRHYWQGDQWIVVGKGPSNSDTKRRHNMISDSPKRNTGIRGSTRQKSHNVRSRAIKRNAHSIVNQTEDRSAKISRTVERSLTNACNATGIRLRFTERKGPATTEVTLKETQHHEDSSLSSTGSCSSFNTNNSSHQYCTTKNAEHHYGNNVSDAESCIGPTSHKPTKVIKWRRQAAESPVQQRCSLILRFRIQDQSASRSVIVETAPGDSASISIVNRLIVQCLCQSVYVLSDYILVIKKMGKHRLGLVTAVKHFKFIIFNKNHFEIILFSFL